MLKYLNSYDSLVLAITRNQSLNLFFFKNFLVKYFKYLKSLRININILKKIKYYKSEKKSYLLDNGISDVMPSFCFVRSTLTCPASWPVLPLILILSNKNLSCLFKFKFYYTDAYFTCCISPQEIQLSIPCRDEGR